MRATILLVILLSFGFVYGQQPIARNDSAYVLPFSVDTIHVIANDSSITGDSLCIISIYGPPYFSLLNCGDILYRPYPGFYGRDSCTYVVCDRDTLTLCDTVKLMVWVNTNDSLLPLLEHGKVWNVCGWFAENPTCSITISLGNDTIIGNNKYTEVIQNFGAYDCWEFSGVDSIAGWIREDSLKRVYILHANYGLHQGNSLYCNSTDSTESLLYDFSLQQGDTMFFPNGYVIMDSVKVVDIEGRVRKRWTSNSGGGSIPCGWDCCSSIIEGIGSTAGLLSPYWSTFENGFNLRGVTKDTTLLFEGGCFNVGFSNIPIQKLKLYPNPTSDFCTLQLTGNGQAYSAVIVDITGREVQNLFDGKYISTFSFNTSGLASGLYFVRVKSNSSDSRSVLMGKLVKE